MKRVYFYGNAATSQTGDMICSVCHKPIDYGDYRYRETPDRYITQHRKCVTDYHFLSRDKEKEDLEQFLVDRQKAIMLFVERWGNREGLLEVVEDALRGHREARHGSSIPGTRNVARRSGKRDRARAV